MKTLKLSLALFLVGVVLSPAARGEQRLTLVEAIQRALEVSDVTRISQEDLNVAQWQASESADRRLPQLDLAGQYLYTSDVMSIVQAPMTVALPAPLPQVSIPGKNTPFGDHHMVDFKLQVTQPLFTGFRLNKTFRAAQYHTQIKQAELERVRWQVRCQAEEQYLQVQKAAALLESAHLRVERLQRHLADAQRRVTAGVAPEEVAVRAEYGLSQAQYRLQEITHNYRWATLSLKELLKLPQEETLSLDSLNYTQILVPATRAAEAFRHRAEFAALEAQLSSARERIGMEKASYYPTLAAFGSVNYGRPGIDKIANEWMLYEMAGLSLNWTLWDWAIRKRKVEEVRAAQRQLELARSALESRVRLEVLGAQLGWENSEQRLTVAREGLQLAEQISKWVETRYQQGAATEIEYQDAQDDLASSQIETIVAAADYHLATVALIRALGAELRP